MSSRNNTKKAFYLNDLEVQEVVRCLVQANTAPGETPEPWIWNLVNRVLIDTGNDQRIITEDYHQVMREAYIDGVDLSEVLLPVSYERGA